VSRREVNADVEPTSPETPPRHHHRGLLALVAVSLIGNAVLVVLVVLVVWSAGFRDWTADELDLAREGEARPAAEVAAGALARAEEALVAAGEGPTVADLEGVEARVSNFDLRVSAVETRVRDLQALQRAACDWARLQETNAFGTELANVFLDYRESVCGG
jgi:hypothetical protein